MRPTAPPPRTRHPPTVPPSQIDLVHARIRREVAAYKRQTREREEAIDRLHGRSRRSADNDEATAKEQVGYGCAAVDRLLDQLVLQSKEEDALLDAALFAQSNANPKEKVELELIDEVQTLRTLASDDTSLETNSVADYAGEPPSAPGFSSTSVVEVRDELWASCGKMADSLDTILSILNGSPHWWTSPIVMRRLKTHGIRIDYHARKMKKWANQCRAHLFVSSSILNRAALEGTSDLIELRTQQSTFQKRKERLLKKRNDLQAVAEDLSRAADDVAQLQERLVRAMGIRAQAIAQQWVPLDEGSAAVNVLPDNGETVLLLAVASEQFPELAPHIDVLMHFFAGVKMPSSSPSV